jgi:HAD superfamily phosphatase (TIGR01668 family)
MNQYLAPDQLVSSVTEISFKELAKKGIKVFVFDVDNTLTFQGGTKIAKPILKKLEEAAECGTVVIATNNSHDRGGVFPSYVKIFKPHNFGHYLFFRKPFNNYYRSLVKEIGCQPDQAVMIGDKYFFDINPAKKWGLKAILVNPIGKDLWGDRLLKIRRYEAKVLASLGLKRPS